MLEIVVCSEDIESNKWLNNIIEDYLLSNRFDFRINIFISQRELYNEIAKGFRFNILLLDIYLENANGIGFPRLIRSYDKNCTIILLSASPENAILGYSVHAFDFLVRPLDRSRVIRTMAEAVGRCGHLHNDLVALKVKGAEATVRAANIVYIESDKHYLRFYMAGGEQYHLYGKLDDYEEAFLTRRPFLRCHQSFLINMDHVRDVSSRDFIMSDESIIPIRKSNAAKIKKAYHCYILENRHG